MYLSASARIPNYTVKNSISQLFTVTVATVSIQNTVFSIKVRNIDLIFRFDCGDDHEAFKSDTKLKSRMRALKMCL